MNHLHCLASTSTCHKHVDTPQPHLLAPADHCADAAPLDLPAAAQACTAASTRRHLRLHSSKTHPRQHTRHVAPRWCCWSNAACMEWWSTMHHMPFRPCMHRIQMWGSSPDQPLVRKVAGLHQLHVGWRVKSSATSAAALAPAMLLGCRALLHQGFTPKPAYFKATPTRQHKECKQGCWIDKGAPCASAAIPNRWPAWSSSSSDPATEGIPDADISM